MNRRYRHRGPTPARPTDASRALTAARNLARLQQRHVAAGVGVHPRTVGRWEIGKSHPSKTQWSKVVAFLARFVPDAAAKLAHAADVPSPLSPPAVVDDRTLQDAIVHAADQLDVSPRRVRAVVRALAAAAKAANATLADLARVAEEPTSSQPARGAT
jgi:transcriptional regulator with XRE-family HTH domain